MSDWHFRQQRPDETVRNPVQGEHFSDEAIERPAQALVREAIQNSLDAAANDREPVAVRFFLSGDEAAVDSRVARFWFGGAWPHVTARNNGLRSVPREPQRCPFLVVEDFGTTGLEGDPAQWQPPPTNSSNRFFSFFRAEGFSDKTGKKAGRWGVGKTVFPRSSEISSFFGLTVRRNDLRRLLMGHSILFYHHVRAVSYAPDGYFGERSENDLTLPIEDSDRIGRFIADFGLHRGEEPGLSLVVPYYDDIEIATTDILSAVIVEYFYPILAGELSVRVRGPGLRSGQGDINADNLMDRLAQHQGSYDAGLDDVVRLAVWARDVGQENLITLAATDSTAPPEWSSELVPEEVAPIIADRFKKGERLAFRIPVTVRATGENRARTYFDLYLQNDFDGRGYPPIFVRNGIRIPKVRERRVHGQRILAIVVIDHRPLASLLGDAETPAHTHWSSETRNFKGKYEHGKAIIEFVSHAPRQIAEILSRKYEQQDRLILVDLFPRPPLDDGITGEQEPQPDAGEEAEHPLPPEQSRPDPFRVERVEGGFRVSRGTDNRRFPRRIRIDVAYDRSRGNPLRRYHPSDFQIQDLQTEVAGAAIAVSENNHMVLRVHDPDAFVVQVTGFDPRRDMFVRVRPDVHRDD